MPCRLDCVESHVFSTEVLTVLAMAATLSRTPRYRRQHPSRARLDHHGADPDPGEIKRVSKKGLGRNQVPLKIRVKVIAADGSVTVSNRWAAIRRWNARRYLVLFLPGKGCG